MDNATQLTSLLSDGGIFGVFGLLVTAIILLYRRQTSLTEEFHNSIKELAVQQASSNATMVEALQKNNEALQEVTKAVTSMEAIVKRLEG
jgi:hypothetical protein